MVRSRLYALQDIETHKGISRNKPFYASIQTGQKLAMSMLYYFEPGKMAPTASNVRSKNPCPVCGTINGILDRKGLNTCWYESLDSRGTRITRHKDHLINSRNITSSNLRCRHIYRTVLEISDSDDEILNETLDPWTITLSYCRPWQDTEDNTENTTILDSISRGALDLLSSKTEYIPVDSPDMFKRARYLTRWEDNLECRGDLLQRFGRVGFWGFSNNDNWALAARKQMSYSVYELLRSSVKHAVGPWLYIFGFVGNTRQDSVLCILILSNHKSLQDRSSRLVKQLAWVKSNQRVWVGTGRVTDFLQTEDVNQVIKADQDNQDWLRKIYSRREMMGLVATN